MQLLKTLSAIFLLTMVILSACKEPDGIGLDVLPEGEEMPIAWVDTFTIWAETVRFDSVRTSGRGTYAIGDFGDPKFGRVQSQMYAQFTLSAEPGPFTTADVVDSLFLTLRYVGSYGRVDKLKGRHRFGVFEILEDLNADSVYYSDDTVMNVSTTPLADLEFHPDLLNPVVAGSDTLTPSLRIRLDNSLGYRIVTSTNLNDNDLFVEEFKGLNIRSLSPQMPDDHGSLLFFDMASAGSRLEMFYHNAEDTLQYSFEMNNDNALFTNVYHDFKQEITDAMNGGTAVGNNRLYVQSLAGTRVRLKFPFLRELNKLGAVAINKAELVVPVDEDALDDFSVPNILTINRINASDSAFSIIDQTEINGIDYFGGIYDSDNKQYVLNVARELQSLLSDTDRVDYGFYLASLVAVDGKRVVLNGPMHPTRPLKLRLTYTIID